MNNFDGVADANWFFGFNKVGNRIKYKIRIIFRTAPDSPEFRIII